MTFLKQVWILTRLGLANEFADGERILAPLLFALLFVLLLFFALGELPATMGPRVFVAESFLAMFFALQMAFARIYEPEQEDKAMVLFRFVPVHPLALFLSKWIYVLLFSSLITLFTIGMGAIFLGQELFTEQSGVFILILFLVLLGLSSLGVLLSGLTARTRSKQVLFPLLFFPLTAPVLIIGVQCAIFALEESRTLAELSSSWLGLLIVFDLLYCTIGLLLFDELMHVES